MVGPFIVEIEKKASGSGLYIPWRGTYWVALIFFLTKCFSETPYCSSTRSTFATSEIIGGQRKLLPVGKQDKGRFGC